MKISGKGGAALGAVAGVTLLASPVESSHAAVSSETEFFSFGTASPDVGNFLLNFNQFNPALGTLTAVNFTLESAASAEASVSVNGGGAAASGTTENPANFQVQVNSPSLGTIFGPAALLAAAECTATSEDGFACSDSGFVSAPFDGTFGVPGGSIGGFAGAGNFDAEMDFSTTLENVCAGGLEPSCEHLGSISWQGTLTVEYTFTPAAAAAPEPATLILLGAGLGALGLVGRRRKLAVGG